MERLGKNLADFLIDEELVRPPTATGTEPVVFVDPTEGAPAPGDLKGRAVSDITLTIQTDGGSASQPYFGFIDQLDLMLIYRVKPGKEKDLIDFSNSVDYILDDKRAFTMGALRVEIAQRIGPLDLLSISDKGEGNVYSSTYSFLVRKINLNS
jgi:hypothetical protein